MYETVKTVNGYPIQRMKGSKGVYTLKIDDKRSMMFRTQKAASEMAAKMDSKSRRK